MIIYLSNSFSHYIESHVEQAAFDVLTACGYNIQVLPVVDAGASLLSKGFVDAAKRHAEKVLDALNQVDPMKEAVIVGIEPPEIYMLKNDYIDLLPGRMDEIASRSARTWLLDEYLLRSENLSKFRVVSKTDDTPLENTQCEKVYFQPHCHQRAEGPADDGIPTGANATVEVLRACGYEVELLDTGCCGMAGTFGYEADHYELSMKVGETALFPIIRKLMAVGRKTNIVSTGASCRMQIVQGTSTNATHPIEWVSKRIIDIR